MNRKIWEKMERQNQEPQHETLRREELQRVIQKKQKYPDQTFGSPTRTEQKTSDRRISR